MEPVNVNKILDEVPLWPIVIVAIVFLFTPFRAPHLWAKIQMFRNGVPLAPVDWFDLMVHTLPALIAVLRVRRAVQVRRAGSTTPDTDAE